MVFLFGKAQELRAPGRHLIMSWLVIGRGIELKEKKKEWSIPEANDCVREKCPEMSGKIKLIFSMEAFAKIVLLTKKISDYEWGAYLVGEQRDNKTFYIKDLVIPKQKVSRASVEFEEENFPENCVGWIHSHNSMRAYLSETDISTASVYKVSVVVNNDLQFAAGCKLQLPCGRIGILTTESPVIEIEGAEVDTSNIEMPEEEELVRASPKDLEICPVCNQKVSPRKGEICEYCGELAHRKCGRFYHGIFVCDKCYEIVKEAKERGEVIGEYDGIW